MLSRINSLHLSERIRSNLEQEASSYWQWSQIGLNEDKEKAIMKPPIQSWISVVLPLRILWNKQYLLTGTLKYWNGQAWDLVPSWHALNKFTRDRTLWNISASILLSTSCCSISAEIRIRYSSTLLVYSAWLDMSFHPLSSSTSLYWGTLNKQNSNISL